MKCLLAFLTLFFCRATIIFAFTPVQVILAENGNARVEIIESSKPTPVQNFAVNELIKYLQQISGAQFSMGRYNAKAASAIRIEYRNGKIKEAYSITVHTNNIILSGNSDRAVLYAVYDFLSRLGCVWIAPAFDLYEGHAEIIPHNTHLIYAEPNNITQQPVFAYRVLDVDGGRTHNAVNLKQIIDWMPKVRYNTLRVPVNLNGNDRVQWDKWRNELMPELKKRAIIIEVGGHGYQNFLNAKMENGTLFEKHPGWFGRDSSCKLSPSERLVFNTSNQYAVKYFINNVVNYLKQHPEIDIFGLWPPDVGRWADCPEMQALGTPPDRQAVFANQVNQAIKKIRPGLKLEIIAYSYTLAPPSIRLKEDILVDFCPINQSFEKQVYDNSSPNNAEYVNHIQAWGQKFKGHVGLYSYYRKYAWRSAPNVIPHYIQRDMQWYAAMSLKGISTYAEPGDWYTYELNHFVLGNVAWDPKINVDSLCDLFFQARYGTAWKAAGSAYAALEQITPVYGSIPFTSLKSKEAIDIAAKNTEAQIVLIESSKLAGKDRVTNLNLSRLLLMLQYLHMDLQIQHALAAKAPQDEVIEQIKKLLSFLEANLDKGLFILTGDNDLARFTKKYGLTGQSLLD